MGAEDYCYWMLLIMKYIIHQNRAHGWQLVLEPIEGKSDPKKPPKPDERQIPEKYKDSIPAIRELIKEKYFVKPKLVSEVQAELKMKKVTGALNWLVKYGELKSKRNPRPPQTMYYT